MTKFTAITGSSILDVCLNTYGNLNYLAKLMNDNGIEGINTRPTAGQVFEFDEKLVSTQNNGAINQNYNIVQSISREKYATAAD
jgi:hypothetical protein